MRRKEDADPSRGKANKQTIEILRLVDSPTALIAVARIEELEASLAYCGAERRMAIACAVLTEISSGEAIDSMAVINLRRAVMG